MFSYPVVGQVFPKSRSVYDKREEDRAEQLPFPTSFRISFNTIHRAQNPETPKSLKKVFREEFGTPRTRIPKKQKKSKS